MKSGAMGHPPGEIMNITLNGDVKSFPTPTTLLDLMHSLKLPSLERGVAVCVNGEVVRRPDWEGRQLQPGDELEVVQATQGG